MKALTLDGFLENPWLFFVAAAVAIVGVGRLNRLVTYDDYPPAIWLRTKWAGITKGGLWGKIAFCIWCFSPYAAGFAVGWLVLGLLVSSWIVLAWWIFFGWLTIAYLASILTYFDEGKPDAD